MAEFGGKERKYNWCLSNDVKIGTGVGQGYLWEYCSLVGYTVKNDDCGLNGRGTSGAKHYC